MAISFFLTTLLLSSFSSFFPVLVRCDCECGYTTTIDDSTYTFTDLLESDFLHLRNVSLDTDWVRQNYTVDGQRDRGSYGENATVGNIISNPLVSQSSWSGPALLAGDAGLQLVVRGGVPLNGYVPVAEMDSRRVDMRYGSYRAAIRLTDVPGTCGAFYWYFNDSQEIDMEFLSAQFDTVNNVYPVNLVMQSAASVAAGYNAANSGNYIVANLTFNPSDAFHEYRIDFTPDKVHFYADSIKIGSMDGTAIPSQPGHLILSQWSNGNPLWSSGPPATDAIMAVSYIKAYFNSSSAQAQHNATERCSKNPNGKTSVCAIPDQTIAPDPSGPNGNVTAATYFFTQQHNSTTGQTVYRQQASAITNYVWFALSMVLFVTLVAG